MIDIIFASGLDTDTMKSLADISQSLHAETIITGDFVVISPLIGLEETIRKMQLSGQITDENRADFQKSIKGAKKKIDKKLVEEYKILSEILPTFYAKPKAVLSGLDKKYLGD